MLGFGTDELQPSLGLEMVFSGAGRLTSLSTLFGPSLGPYRQGPGSTRILYPPAQYRRGGNSRDTLFPGAEFFRGGRSYRHTSIQVTSPSEYHSRR